MSVVWQILLLKKSGTKSISQQHQTGNRRQEVDGWHGQDEQQKNKLRVSIRWGGKDVSHLWLGQCQIIILQIWRHNTSSVIKPNWYFCNYWKLAHSEYGNDILRNICPDGFAAFHKPRLDTVGGGVALLFRDSIRDDCSFPVIFEAKSFEYLSTSLMVNSICVRVVMMYLSFNEGER